MSSPRSVPTISWNGAIIRRRRFSSGTSNFRKYYASLGLEAELRRAYESTKDADKLAFTKTYLNEPGWAATLRMVAAHLGNQATSDELPAADIGAFLVNATLPPDAYSRPISRDCAEQRFGRASEHRSGSVFAPSTRLRGAPTGG